MELNEILNQLNNLFKEFLDEPDLVLELETTADDVEEWNSLNHLQIIVVIEKHFELKFNHREVAILENTGALCELISLKLN